MFACGESTTRRTAAALARGVGAVVAGARSVARTASVALYAEQQRTVAARRYTAQSEQRRDVVVERSVLLLEVGRRASQSE